VNSVIHTLSRIIKGKTVFLGVGNVLRGDDGFGPALIERIRGNVDAVCIDAGSAPENYAGKIIKEAPDTVIIVDAAHLGRKSGEYEILKKEDIARAGFTTHDQSPDMFIGYLEANTEADIYMLAVQPEKVLFGEDMSASVKKAIEEITRAIKGGNHA
jgi:hydrogenase 3 maturation protease